MSSANLIGIKALKDYNKFQVVTGGIMLKRSSLSIILYVFLGLFTVIASVMILGCWKDAQFGMGFIRSIFKASFLKDDRARI